MNKIGIYGLGLIGSSLGLAFKKYLPSVNVYGKDIKQRNEIYSLNNNIIDKTINKDNLSDLDIIFLSLPISKSIDVIDEIFPLINYNKTIITDTGSTKNELINQITNKYPEVKYIGGHPLAGKAKSGPEYGEPDLFLNKLYFLITDSSKNTDNYNYLKTILSSIGAKVNIIKADLHDKYLSYTSHMPQLISSILINNIYENLSNEKLINKFTGTGLLSMVRLAQSNPDMWLDIFMTNSENIIDNIDKYINKLEAFKNAINKNDKDRILSEITTANKNHDKLIKR